MTIPYLPGPEATVGPALGQITQAIGQLIDPNFEFRKTFEKALAANPQLLQQLADLEFTSGGIVSRDLAELFSPRALSAVTGARPSAQAVTEKAVGETIPQVAGLTAEELPTEPTLMQQAAVRALTGTTAGGLQQENLEGRLRRVAGQYLSTLTPERYSQIGAFASIPALMSDEHFIQQLDLQERIFGARRADRISEFQERLREQNAIWWQRSTGVGTADDWDTYFSAEGRKRIERLKTGGAGVTLTGEDERLLAVDEYYRTVAPAERKTLDLNRVAAGITKSLEGVSTADNDSVRAGLLSVLNQQLANFSQLADQPLIEARWAERGLLRGVLGGALSAKGLVLINTATKEELSPEDVATLVSTVQVSGPRVAPAASPQAPLSGGVTPAVRWNQLRLEMFPNIPAGGLTPAQVNAVTARVNSEVQGAQRR